jgi:hypothetical protein
MNRGGKTMPASIEQTRVALKEIPPLGSKINWWAVLGLLCMVASAFLSVAVLMEVVDFLKAVGILEVLPFPG